MKNMHAAEAAAFQLDNLQGEQLLLSTANRQHAASEGDETHHSSPAGSKRRAPGACKKSVNSGKAREPAMECSSFKNADPQRDEDRNRLKAQTDKENANPKRRGPK